MAYSYDHYRHHDPTFKADLIASGAHVTRVAAWLRARGYTVRVKPIRIRPDETRMGAYTDNGDLELYLAGQWRTIDVKQRRLNFTGPHDYPYPTVMVTVAHTWDRATVKPHGYILTNEATTACAVVQGSTYPTWRRRRITDRHKHRDRTIYEAPLHVARFYDMTTTSIAA